MAQAVLGRLLSARGIPAEVRSAGLLPGGAPLPRDTEEALDALGLGRPLAGFASTQVTLDAVRGSDLVLGMTREHLRELIVAVPDAWGHTFTLKELVRRGERAGARGLSEDLAPWLERVAEGRARAELLGSSPEDDVDDPIGGGASAFERTAREIEDLCKRLAGLAWP